MKEMASSLAATILMVFCATAKAVIVTNVTVNSTRWYVDITAVGPTAYVTMRGNALQPSSNDFPVMSLHVTNLPYGELGQLTGTPAGRSVEYYDNGKAIIACGGAGVSLVCAAGGTPSAGTDTFVCSAQYNETADSGFRNCVSGTGSLIAQAIKQNQAWSGAAKQAGIDDLTCSSALSTACALAPLVTSNDPVPGINGFIETWPRVLHFNHTHATNSFVVRNAGGGVLTGSATVSKPFTILSGGSYNLGSNQSQTVTIAFRPAAPGSYSENVTLTGGKGASVALTGRLLRGPSNLQPTPTTP